MTPLTTTTTLFLLFLSQRPPATTGHGYLKSPRSRNYVAYADGVWSGGTPTTPAKESCPHCLNLGGTLGRCGVVQGRSYDTPPSATGETLPFNSQMTVTEGGELDLEVVLTAHHKGHFEYYACPVEEGEVPTQECFDANPMVFMRDNLYGAVPHPDYPERAYIPLNNGQLDQDTSGPSGHKFSHRYSFPIGLTGERVLIQWHYVTANSCLPEGYDTYDWPAGFYPGGLAACGQLPPDGNGVPEQFWNCAEISITPAGPTTPTNPPPPTPPTPAPTRPPTPPIKPPTATPSQSPSKELSTPTIGTTPCGGGIVGNGICSDSSLCCSEWGHCGTSTDHCGRNPNPPPVPPPPPTTPPPATPPTAPGAPVTDNRLIAYLGNWQSCPPIDQVQPYTHIIIGFAVSYTYSPAKNICSETCEIATPPICSNAANPNLVSLWKSMGKKVLLSFGGAGMGGSWDGDNNDCWEYCYGRETQVVDRLLDIVEELGLDGVDIDYEYFYDNNQNGSGFAKGDEAKAFLNEVTLGLRAGMGPGKELAHAPMDPDLVPGKGYYDLVKTWGQDDVLDFIMPQYYNGLTRPVNDPDGAMSHYSTLVEKVFKNDPTKMVFGFCISDCSGTGSNANGAQAAAMMSTVRDSYACNGGAFFWVADHDGNGAWSSVVSNEIAPYRGCSVVTTPTASPVTIGDDDDDTTTVSPSDVLGDDDDASKAPVTSPVGTPTTVTTSPSEFEGDDDSTTSPITSSPTKTPPTPSPVTPTKPPKPTLPPTPSPVNPPTNPPTKAPIAAPPTDNCSLSCNPGYTGLKAYAGCTKFYHCVAGKVTGSPIPCASGTLFDERYQYCNWESQVTCPPCSPTVAPVAAPVAPPTPPTGPCCPAGYTGLKAYDGCKKFFHCVNGVVTGSPLPCGRGTLFDADIQNCNWKNQVECKDEERCGRRRLRG